MTIIAEFGNEQEIQRILYLVHQDIARCEGNIILAQRKMDRHTSGEAPLAGRMRRKAAQVLDTTPAQIEVLVGAQNALRTALREARLEEEV